MNYTKTIIFYLLMYVCASQTFQIYGKSLDNVDGKKHTFDAVPEENLKKTIVSIYNKSLHTKISDILPFEFKTCARKLINGDTVTSEECKQVLTSYTELISTIINIHVRNVTSNNHVTPIDYDACPANDVILGILEEKASIITNEHISQSLLNIESSLSDATCNARLLHKQDIGTFGFRITTPGVYKLSEDVVFTPTASTAALTITTSNVLLDLQCFSLKQTGTIPNVHGISISSGGNTLENITVQGGLVSNISGTGIFVSQVSNFNLHNMTFTKCGLAGIDIEGTNNGVFVDNCNISLSCTAGNDLGVLGTVSLSCIQLSTITNGKISNCNIYNNQVPESGTAVPTIFGLNMTSCNGVNIENIVSSGNLCSEYRGFNITSCADSIATNCSSQQDQGQNGGVIGFSINSCSGISVFNSSIQGMISGRDVAGFALNGSTGSLFQDCVVIDNTNLGQRFRGIYFNSSSFSAAQNCLISRNAGSTPTSGIDLSGSNNLISGCKATFNTSSGDICQGLFVNGDSNIVVDCDFSENNGDVDADSFGVNIAGGANNLFSRVRAYNNGTTPANQLNGVTDPGSQVALTASTMNTTTNAGTFGNAGIVP